MLLLSTESYSVQMCYTVNIPCLSAATTCTIIRLPTVQWSEMCRCSSENGSAVCVLCKQFTFVWKGSNVVANKSMLLFHNAEAQGSNTGPETNYPDWGSSWFSSFLQANARTVPQIRPQALPFQIIIHVSSYHLTANSMSYWQHY
jgi:hypothetical protein